MARSLVLAVTLVGAVSAWGQSAISAHAGMINYVEGKVLLDGQTVEPKFAEFPEVKNDQVLSTDAGRAEVLLTPGVLLRLSEDSSFRMISNRLTDTTINVVSGEAIIEVDELLKDNAITVQLLGSTTALTKKGLYRFDVDRHRIRVYDGLATAVVGDESATARKGKEIQLADNGDKLEAQFFDSKDTDPFYRWTERRSEYISTANISSARQAGSMGLLASGGSSWAFNPYYGMFTFLPGAGYGYNPYGYQYYSPATVAVLFYNYGGYNNALNNNLGSLSRAGNAAVGNTSGGAAAMVPARATAGFASASAGPSISAPVSASPVSSGGGGAVGGGGGGAVSVSGGGAAHGAAVASGGGAAHK